MSTLILTDLRVTNVKDAGGNNPSTPAEIQQGRAKAWFNLNGTGTIAARDTFNVSSFVDNGAGNYSANFASALGNANFGQQFSAGDPTTGMLAGGRSNESAPTSTFVRFGSFSAAISSIDGPYVFGEMTGD